MTWAYILNGVGKVDIVNPAPANTNNVAEYMALGFAIRDAIALMREKPGEKFTLTIRGDSQLVVNQINRSWQCNKEHLAKLRDRCLELLNSAKLIGLEKWSIVWIPREQNEKADALGREIYLKTTGHKMPERARKKS
jgi:ribonuclease HI